MTLSKDEEQEIQKFLSFIITNYADIVDKTDASWGVWWESRRTPVGVQAESSEEAIRKARKQKKRGSGKARARQLTSKERKAASKGWLRTGPNGEPAGYNKSKRGEGPKPKADSNDSGGELTTDEFTITSKMLNRIGDYLETASDITEDILTESLQRLTEE